MAWYTQATNPHLNQFWARSMSPYGVARPQWVYLVAYYHHTINLFQSTPNKQSMAHPGGQIMVSMSWYHSCDHYKTLKFLTVLTTDTYHSSCIRYRKRLLWFYLYIQCVNWCASINIAALPIIVFEVWVFRIEVLNVSHISQYPSNIEKCLQTLNIIMNPVHSYHLPHTQLLTHWPLGDVTVILKV